MGSTPHVKIDPQQNRLVLISNNFQKFAQKFDKLFKSKLAQFWLNNTKTNENARLLAP